MKDKKEYYRRMFEVHMAHVAIGDATIRKIPKVGLYKGYDRIDLTGFKYTLFVFRNGKCLFKAIRDYLGGILVKRTGHKDVRYTIADWTTIKEMYDSYV